MTGGGGGGGGASVVAGAVTCGCPSVATEIGAAEVTGGGGVKIDAGGACGWPSPIWDTGAWAAARATKARTLRTCMVIFACRLW